MGAGEEKGASVNWDSTAGVLYVQWSAEPTTHGEDRGNGVIVRYTDAGEVGGVTLLRLDSALPPEPSLLPSRVRSSGGKEKGWGR